MKTNRQYQQVALQNSAKLKPSVESKPTNVQVSTLFEQASAQVFALLQIISNQTTNYVPSSVAEFLHEHLDNFENILYQAGYPYRSIRFSQYCLAICADTILLNSDWGQKNNWYYHQLTAHIHYQPNLNDQLQKMLDYLAHESVDWHLLNFVYTCVALMAQCPKQKPIDWSQHHYPLYLAVKKRQPKPVRTNLLVDDPASNLATNTKRFRWPIFKTSGFLALMGLGYASFVIASQYEQLLTAVNLLSVAG